MSCWPAHHPSFPRYSVQLESALFASAYILPLRWWPALFFFCFFFKNRRPPGENEAESKAAHPAQARSGIPVERTWNPVRRVSEANTSRSASSGRPVDKNASSPDQKASQTSEAAQEGLCARPRLLGGQEGLPLSRNLTRQAVGHFSGKQTWRSAACHCHCASLQQRRLFS